MAVSHADATHNKAKIEHHDYGRNCRCSLEAGQPQGQESGTSVKEIVIIGGGFGGVWSAASAASMRRDAGSSGEDLSITLTTPGQDMVIRPRLDEAGPGDMGLSLSRILAPIGVQHLRASVSSIDVS